VADWLNSGTADDANDADGFNAEAQGHRDTETQRHRDTERKQKISRRGAKAQRSRGRDRTLGARFVRCFAPLGLGVIISVLRELWTEVRPILVYYTSDYIR
jgi:hypothetical protein